MVDIERLVEHPDNPNQHSQEQIALLAKILRVQGWRVPIVVSARSGFMTHGHARRMAAIQNGWTKVPVDVQPYENEAMEFADLIADNKIQELSVLDQGKLNDPLAFLKDQEGFDIELTGFAASEVDSILESWAPDAAVKDVTGSDEPAPAVIKIKCRSTDEDKVRTAIEAMVENMGLDDCHVE
jgi:ParB-like chromosome segregation protein Spo0J